MYNTAGYNQNEPPQTSARDEGGLWCEGAFKPRNNIQLLEVQNELQGEWKDR